MDAETRVVEIRQATQNELEAAYEVAKEYFAEAKVVAREDREEFKKAYFGEGARFWLATCEQTVVGCVGLRGMSTARSAEIKRMYVRKEFRGRNVAQRLLDAAEGFAKQCRYAWIYLDTTDEMTAAARLYERNGYARCERYNENPQATIFMRKRLQTE